jgi:hypothetical protein
MRCLDVFYRMVNANAIESEGIRAFCPSFFGEYIVVGMLCLVLFIIVEV